MLQVQNKYVNYLILTVILIVAVVLRFNYLQFESLWLDELHTMNEADPSLPWSELFNSLMCCDQHPPIFFIVERIMFSLFGHNEYVARIAPALAGVGCVWAMYKLGKEVLNERLGLIAAAITCLNYFNIYYAQEARGYIFLWFFTILSFTYFLRFAKYLKRADSIWYVLSTVLLLYSHYFSLLIIFCQLILFIILWAAEKDNKLKFFKSFFIVELIILIVYVPWLPYLKEMSNIESFWIQKPSQDFYYYYLLEYIGSSNYLMPFINITLIIYCVNVFAQKGKFTEIKKSPLLLSFIFIFISVVITYIVMYVRSIVVVPMMVSRYTVVVLPGLFLAIAYGFYLIKNEFIRYTILGVFLFLAFFDIVYVKEFYEKPKKEQFREMTEYILNKSKSMPILNEMTGWHQNYYLKKLGYEGELLSGDKEAIVDSILSKSSSKYDVDTFAVASAHGDPHIEDYKRAHLDTAYTLVDKAEFLYTWVEIYAKKTEKKQ